MEFRNWLFCVSVFELLSNRSEAQRLPCIIWPNLPVPSHVLGRFQGMVLSATGGGTRSLRFGFSLVHEVNTPPREKRNNTQNT
jgi:hypothetical protein